MRRQRGFSMIEFIVALGIMAVLLLALASAVLIGVKAELLAREFQAVQIGVTTEIEKYYGASASEIESLDGAGFDPYGIEDENLQPRQGNSFIGTFEVREVDPEEPETSMNGSGYWEVRAFAEWDGKVGPGKLEVVGYVHAE